MSRDYIVLDPNLPKIVRQMDLSQATFMKSAASLRDCPPDEGAEVAFCGRSNAGKSSAINVITSQKKLARTSKTPGRTRLLNFFAVGDRERLVDLPGYGYAKVAEKVKQEWHRELDTYLRGRGSLAGLILLVDIRHGLKPFDEMMLQWCNESGVPMHILLTKADKLSRGAQRAALDRVRKLLPRSTTIQVFSSLSRLGLEDARARISELLRGTLEASDVPHSDA